MLNFVFFRTRNTVVQRVATPRRLRRIVVTRGECEIPRMVTRTVQPEVWEWAWEQIVTAPVIIPVNLYTRRREKTETISYPPLGTSIPVRIKFFFQYFSKNFFQNDVNFTIFRLCTISKR